MDNQAIYKRTKINWWIILLCVSVYISSIFAYIYQWGNNPITEKGLIIFAILWLPQLLFWRMQLIIDNNNILYRIGFWTLKRMPINRIRKVELETGYFFFEKKYKQYAVQNYALGIAKQHVFVYSQNDVLYTITTKNAQEIKNEIEKRMTKT